METLGCGEGVHSSFTSLQKLVSYGSFPALVNERPPRLGFLAHLSLHFCARGVSSLQPTFVPVCPPLPMQPHCSPRAPSSVKETACPQPVLGAHPCPYPEPAFGVGLPSPRLLRFTLVQSCFHETPHSMERSSTGPGPASWRIGSSRV